MDSVKKNTRRRWSRWVLLGWSAAASTILFIAQPALCAAADDPCEIVTEYLQAWRAGDTEHMYALLDTGSKRELSADDFARVFTVRVPFSTEGYVLRPVSFQGVRSRPGALHVVDYRAVFSVESLLGPDVCDIVCRERRLSLDSLRARQTRLRAMYLLYDWGRPASEYVSLDYITSVMGLVVLQGLFHVPPESGADPNELSAAVWPASAESHIREDTSAQTVQSLRVSAASRPFALRPITVVAEGNNVRIENPLGAAVASEDELPQFDEGKFDQLLVMMGLAEP